jgi:hypothetical protein
MLVLAVVEVAILLGQQATVALRVHQESMVQMASILVQQAQVRVQLTPPLALVVMVRQVLFM